MVEIRAGNIPRRGERAGAITRLWRRKRHGFKQRPVRKKRQKNAEKEVQARQNKKNHKYNSTVRETKQ